MELKHYKVYVNGVQAEIFPVRVSAYPFNRVWPGKQRDISQTQESGVIRLFGLDRYNITVECDTMPKSVTIRPLSKNIKAQLRDSRVSFVLQDGDKVAVELGSRNNTLHFFCSNESPYPREDEVTYYFGKGEHRVGMLKLKDGESVYIHKDAVVHASLYAIDAENIRIFGNGILVGDMEVRTHRHGDIGFDGENEFAPEKFLNCGCIRAYRCKSISVSGITVTDPATYAISFFDTQNITVNDVNVVGLWKYNTDGIDFFNCKQVRADNCFIRSFDDCMCMKGLTAFSYTSMTDVLVTNCIFWCDWGKNFDIGLASACKEMAHITWRDCDIIHGSDSCITVSNGQWADVHDIKYENINIEYSLENPNPVYQEDDDSIYTDDGTVKIPYLVYITDMRRKWQGNISYDDIRTKIRNIYLENINIYLEDGINKKPEIVIKKTSPSSYFGEISISNVTINGIAYDEWQAFS